MNSFPIALRVASRFRMRLAVTLRFLADQPKGERKRVQDLTKPINRPKGIKPDIVRENARGVSEHKEDSTKPDRRDIRPEDVFHGTPNQMSVRNLAETGKDLEKPLDKQIPKDKGYDAVRNLSQYLIRTDGGGGAEPAGKKLSHGNE